MRAGRSLQDIAAELERQANSRQDYIAPQGKIEAVVKDGEVVLDGINHTPFAVTNYAHGQFAQHLGIPKQYFDRMRAEQPELLAQNLNTWLHAAKDERRMLRTLDGKVRAFLSPKFRALDNFDLANAVLPTLLKAGVKVMSSELTETRLYIKGILPGLSDAELVDMRMAGHEHHIMKDSRLVAAIVISNSDVGAGTLRVEPSVFTTRCTNLAIVAQAAMKKYHVGRANSADEGYEVFKDETRRADDAAFWLKVRDVTMAAFNEDTFKKAITQIRQAQGQVIQSDNLPAVVEATIEVLSLPERASNGILKALAAGGDLSQWGLSSAITATANVLEADYEITTALERAGGEVMALAPKDWSKIAEAA